MTGTSSTGGLFSFPSGVETTSGVFRRHLDRWGLHQRRVQGSSRPSDGKDPSRLDTAAASWRPPKARAGYPDCGSDSHSSDRSPRSPRTSDDAPTWTHATDNCHTVAAPIDPRAGTQAGSGLAPSCSRCELCQSRCLGMVVPHSMTRRLGALSTVPFPLTLWGTGTALLN